MTLFTPISRATAKRASSVFHLWLTKRWMTAGRGFLSLSATMSLLGMTLGVACLVVSMGVISGFETTLRETVTDVAGHISVVRHSTRAVPIESALARVRNDIQGVESLSVFLEVESLLAHKQKIAGVMLQGLDLSTVDQVLNLRPRLIAGEFIDKKNASTEVPGVLVGKGIAQQFQLTLGDEFRLILPVPSERNSTEFTPRAQKFRMVGIVDFGKVDFDERILLVDLKSAQRFANVKDGISGFRLRLHDFQQTDAVAKSIENTLGIGFWVSSWRDLNRNLLEAIQIERVAIFVVLSILIVAASLNISTQLFVSVLQKFSQLSILKTLGFRPIDAARVLALQGLFFGCVGTGAGMILGWILCGGFILIQKFFVVMPADVYKIDHVGIDIRAWDMLAIVVASLFICLLSTLAPAYRASRLSPVEGLRYE